MATFQAGYQGFFVDQLIKTANKLQLQGAAATMDLLNAQLALRKARTDVAYQVRTNYFAVLVALENVKLSRAFARFTNDIYSAQVKLMKGTVAAFYEPMQLRTLANAARLNLITASNQYQASWRQLAVSLGLPDMPPSDIAGRVDMPVPLYEYQDVLQRMLSQHTDVLTAQNNIHKGRYLLQLARVTPIPDVGVHVMVQKDYTTPPFLIAPSLAVSVALPIWDRNLGGIQQAEGLLNQAMHNLPVVQNALINSLAVPRSSTRRAFTAGFVLGILELARIRLPSAISSPPSKPWELTSPATFPHSACNGPPWSMSPTCSRPTISLKAPAARMTRTFPDWTSWRRCAGARQRRSARERRSARARERARSALCAPALPRSRALSPWKDRC